MIGKEANQKILRRSQILANMKINVQRPVTMQLRAMPSPSGKSLGVHDQGLPAHLVMQVSRCVLDLTKEYKVSSNRQHPCWGGLGVSSHCTHRNVRVTEAT